MMGIFTRFYRHSWFGSALRGVERRADLPGTSSPRRSGGSVFHRSSAPHAHTSLSWFVCGRDVQRSPRPNLSPCRLRCFSLNFTTIWYSEHRGVFFLAFASSNFLSILCPASLCAFALSRRRAGARRASIWISHLRMVPAP